MAISMLTDPDCISSWSRSNEKNMQRDQSNGVILVQFSLNRLKELYCENKYIADRLQVRKEIFNALKHAATDATPSNPLAKFLFGLALGDGFGCDIADLQTGKALILIAAKVYQDPEALNYLACRQFHINPEVAVKLFRLAAEQGHQHAWKSLGIAYLYGKGVQQDYSEALQCLQQAGDVAADLYQRLRTKLCRDVPQEKERRANILESRTRARFLFT